MMQTKVTEHSKIVPALVTIKDNLIAVGNVMTVEQSIMIQKHLDGIGIIHELPKVNIFHIKIRKIKMPKY